MLQTEAFYSGIRPAIDVAAHRTIEVDIRLAESLGTGILLGINQQSPYNVGLDAAIIMNPQTWVTTGHVSSFSDPLLDCRACKARHRADKLIGEEHPEVNVDAMSFDEMDAFIAEHEDIVCPVCGKHDFTPIRKFTIQFDFSMSDETLFGRNPYASITRMMQEYGR